MNRPIDVVESEYNAGCISRGEAMSEALCLFIADRSNENALGFLCGVITDIKNEETKLADERVARLFAKAD